MSPPNPANTETRRESETFRGVDRLRRRWEYLRVQKHGRRVHTRHFLMMVLSHGQGSRLGITVSKRVGHAVARNRIKRVVREVFRRNRHLFPPHADTVVIGRSGAEQLNYACVLREVEEARRALQREAQLARFTGPTE